MSTTFTSSKTEYQFYLKLTLEEVKAGTASSDPQISYTLQLYSGGWNFELLRITAYVKLGGTIVAQLNHEDKQWTLGTKSNITLLSGTASVPHNGSGSMAVEYAIDMTETFWQYAPDITATGTMPVTSYSKGLIYIGNGSSYDAYQVYIGNGTSWELYIPYVGNGTSWELCS